MRQKKKISIYESKIKKILRFNSKAKINKFKHIMWRFIYQKQLKNYKNQLSWRKWHKLSSELKEVYKIKQGKLKHVEFNNDSDVFIFLIFKRLINLFFFWLINYYNILKYYNLYTLYILWLSFMPNLSLNLNDWIFFNSKSKFLLNYFSFDITDCLFLESINSSVVVKEKSKFLFTLAVQYLLDRKDLFKKNKSEKFINPRFLVNRRPNWVWKRNWLLDKNWPVQQVASKEKKDESVEEK